MKLSQKIEKIANRTSKTTYEGKFKDFQSMGQSFKENEPSIVKEDSFNKVQNHLYKRAMFGLKVYTKAELDSMHWEKKERVKKVHKKTQQELNDWKQQKIIDLTNNVFQVFKKSLVAKAIVEDHSDPVAKFTSRTSFKVLKINKRAIIKRLRKKGLLPSNFETLK